MAQSDSELELELVKKLKDYNDSIYSSYEKINQAKVIGLSTIRLEESVVADINSKRMKEELQLRQKLNNLIKIKEISKQEKENIIKQVQVRNAELDPLKKKQKILEINNELLQEEIRLKKEYGTLAQKIDAKTKEIMSNKSGFAANFAKGAFDNPLGALTEGLGKINPLLQVFAEIAIKLFDETRQNAGQLQSSMAASGNFASKTKMQWIGLAADFVSFGGASQKAFQNLRLTSEETLKVTTEINRTGILKIDNLKDAWGKGMDSIGTATTVFARVSGETEEVVAQRLATIRRNFGVATNLKATETYKKILDSAMSAAKRGTITTSGYIDQVMSLSDSFADLGLDVLSVNKLVGSLHYNLGAMKVPSKVIGEVASGLMNVSKISNEWGAFISIMAGKGHDFISGMGAFQQRGPGFETRALSGGGYNIGQNLKDLTTMLEKTTQNAPDRNTRRFLQESIGQSVGLSPNMVGALLKMKSNGMSTNDLQTEFESLRKATGDNIENLKDLGTLIKETVMTYIFRPLMGILKIFSVPGTQTSDNAQYNYSQINKDVSDSSNRDESLKARYRDGFASGGIVDATSQYMLHAKEEVLTPTNPRHINQISRNSNGGLTLNVNVNIQNDVRQAFRQAEQMTLKEISKYNNTVFGIN